MPLVLKIMHHSGQSHIRTSILVAFILTTAIGCTTYATSASDPVIMGVLALIGYLICRPVFVSLAILVADGGRLGNHYHCCGLGSLDHTQRMHETPRMKTGCGYEENNVCHCHDENRIGGNHNIAEIIEIGTGEDFQGPYLGEMYGWEEHYHHHSTPEDLPPMDPTKPLDPPYGPNSNEQCVQVRERHRRMGRMAINKNVPPEFDEELDDNFESEIKVPGQKPMTDEGEDLPPMDPTKPLEPPNRQTCPKYNSNEQCVQVKERHRRIGRMAINKNVAPELEEDLDDNFETKINVPVQKPRTAEDEVYTNPIAMIEAAYQAMKMAFPAILRIVIILTPILVLLFAMAFGLLDLIGIDHFKMGKLLFVAYLINYFTAAYAVARPQKEAIRVQFHASVPLSNSR